MLQHKENLEAKILSELSLDNVQRHVISLSNIGQRLAGTEEERKTVKYLKKSLEECGVSVEVFSFDGCVSYPQAAELRVIEPEQKMIEASCFAQIAPTPPEGIEGEVVYVGSGGLKEYENVDVKGKITLAELSYSPPRPEKVRLTEKFGAIGQIQINWGGRALPLGTVKSIWGNPTPDSIGTMPRIPAVGVKKTDGDYLKALCAKGTLRVWLKADSWRGWGKVSQPVAEIKGAVEHEKFVLLNGHFDAWGSGSTDNATGNALLLELARVMAKHKKQLRRGVRFAWWTGHETGIMVGSTWYLDNFWSDIKQNCVAYMNCDSVGMRDTLWYAPTSMKETERFHRDTIRHILGEKELARVPAFDRPGKWGDQSFLGMGIPSLEGMTAYPPGKPILGEWYHSIEDTPDKVDLEALDKALRMYAALVFRLCNSRVLPFEFVSVANEFHARLTDLQDMAKTAFDLTPLIGGVRELRRYAGRLDRIARKTAANLKKAPKNRKMLERAESVNRCLMNLSRILIPIGYTTVDKREQDTYGQTGLDRPMPLLNPVVELTKMDPGSDEFRMLATKLVKERNKILDALDEANLLIASILQGID